MNKFKSRTRKYEDKTSYINDEISRPAKESDKLSIEISEKAMRNLPKSTYSLEADPYTSALPGSKPYPILTKFNRKVGGNYKGLRNLDGGNVQQYANSIKSIMLDYADFIYAKLPLNYRNLPVNINATLGLQSTDEEFTTNKDNYSGKNLIDEMRKSIAETTSILSSTTFTQMAINNYAIETDMPMGTAKTNVYNNVNLYDNLTDVIYASSIFYQLVLQAGLNLFNWHNSLRLKMGTMIRRSWNRETPTLNALFGLLKKKSFLSFMDSIALSFEGEYLDLDEMRQINMLTLAPSARSNALTDPVQELAVKLNRPKVFKIYLITPGTKDATLVFDYDQDMTVSYKASAGSTDSLDYFSLIDQVVDLMSAEHIMDWARDPETTASSDTDYYNQIKWKIDAISKALTNFKTLISDVREVYETMSRTGTNNWKKGYVPKIIPDTDADIFDNLVINDIYKIMASSADKVDFDEATKRWRTFTTWNMYAGIPEYDAYQGGSFLTLSLKDLDYSNDSDDIHYYLPIRFTATDGIILNGTNLKDYREFKCSCRDGVEIIVDGTTTLTIQDDTTLARLAPLPSQSTLKIRVPKVTTSGLDVGHKSCIYKTLTQVFGMCQVALSNNTDVSVDPDIVAIYQIELEDITNEAITYARANAPFRGTTSTVDILGFSK